MSPPAAPLARRVCAAGARAALGRRCEAEVWFAFVARARVDSELRALADRVDEALRAIVRAALEPLAPPDADLAVEETYALVDGPALHGVVRRGSPAPDTMRRALWGHLTRLEGCGARVAAAPA